MFIPIWIIVASLLLTVLILAWAMLVAARRNPLPFPDPGSRIFSASSVEAQEALVRLLAQHGILERFKVDTSGISRSIMWDGTIINVRPDSVARKLGGAAASIGLVSADPIASANAAADFLHSRGFSGEVVLDAEPELPIAFVVTDAFVGTVLNFRKHMLHLPRPK